MNSLAGLTRGSQRKKLVIELKSGTRFTSWVLTKTTSHAREIMKRHGRHDYLSGTTQVLTGHQGCLVPQCTGGRHY